MLVVSNRQATRVLVTIFSPFFPFPPAIVPLLPTCGRHRGNRVPNGSVVAQSFFLLFPSFFRGPGDGANGGVTVGTGA